MILTQIIEEQVFEKQGVVNRIASLQNVPSISGFIEEQRIWSGV